MGNNMYTAIGDNAVSTDSWYELRVCPVGVMLLTVLVSQSCQIEGCVEMLLSFIHSITGLLAL